MEIRGTILHLSYAPKSIRVWLLHTSHVEEGQPERRIDKVKSLIEIQIPNFQSCYKPSRDIAIDETMVGFKKRFGAKQS